jgi:DNA helicase-2/ATP-dependent DNA helicase PcrA
LNTTVIGDPWQALYDFRGARSDLVPELVDHEGFEKFPVTASFRFETPEMAGLAVSARTGQPITLDVAPETATDPAIRLKSI